MTNLQICVSSVGDKLAWQYGNNHWRYGGKGTNGSENTCPHCNIFTKYHRHEYVINFTVICIIGITGLTKTSTTSQTGDNVRKEFKST